MATAQQQVSFTAADPALTRRILQFGADDLSRCYQCGTCSVVCPLTPDDQAFPRKEMVWAQWGLQEKLLQDGDVWLCHQCNECTVHCPRDAKPGDLMAAIRTYQIDHYSAPKVLGKANRETKYLLLAFVPPVLLTFLLVLVASIIPQGGLVYPEGDVLFEHFIGHLYIDIFSAIALGFAGVVMWTGGRRFWQAIRRSEVDLPAVRKSFSVCLLLTIGDIMRHTYFNWCKVNRPRGHAHMGILYGFLFLFAATTGAAIYTIILDRELSLPLLDPVKVIGNVGGIALFVGLTWVSWRRLARRHEAGRSDYFDWNFVGVLYALAITGFVLEALRFANLREWAYPMYMVHLVFYFMLVTYLPYTKFAHVIYRTLALVHARQIDRKPGTRRELVVELA